MKYSTLKRTGWKRKKIDKSEVYWEKAKLVATPEKKPKLPSVKSVRNKADSLLTPLIILMHPLCTLCNNPTQVAHHHVHKSKSTRLRYELDNLIPLCHHCHQRLHHNESYWASKVVEQRGIEWFKKISKLGEESVKADVHYYIANRDRLQRLIDELKD